MALCALKGNIKQISILIFVLLFISLVMGCNKASHDTTQIPITHEVKGIAVEILEKKNIIRIKHEEIPNFMDSMTMPFSVKRKQELKNLKEGDQISFELNVTNEESWVENIKILANKKHKRTTHKQSPEITNNNPLRIGDKLPDYSLINQDNKIVKLSSFKGRVLVFTFIYTRCPIPDFCPRMTQNFLNTLNILKIRNINDNYHFLSISFDPDFDTPETLKNYSNALSINNHNWSFATGNKKTINEFTSRFGIIVRQTKKRITDWDHNLRTIVATPEGIVKKIYIGNLWTPEELAEDIKKNIDVSKYTPK
tara:strand:+ start:273 stop:1202 length:930 start_codon:yes stop_codon:yes gene_type:complete